MLNLNNIESFRKTDPQNMLDQINDLPEQLQDAWELGNSLEIPAWNEVRQVVIAGMGGSAIGADLLAAYAAPLGSVPIVVHRDYDLPAWARGSETLVIVSSHSGNTEETLSALHSAIENECCIICVSTGGKISEIARDKSLPLWQFVHEGQPRAAVGYSFGLLLAIFHRLGLLPDPSSELTGAVEAMKKQQERLIAEIPDVNNPAKRMAGQLVDRWVAVLGSGILAPVARRWKGQMSEVAKAWAQFETLPEADHNTLAGIENPPRHLSSMMVIFLRAPSAHPRNRLRVELTRKTMMLEGVGTDMVTAKGDSRLANMWTCLHFGDYTAYYLAMVYGVDPTPVETIESFKLEMKEAGS